MQTPTHTKSLLTGLLAILLIALAPVAKAQLNSQKIFADSYKGVVKLLMFDPELERMLVAKGQPKGSGYLSRGSGFVVTDDGYIFTNRHVVETCVKGYMILDYVNDNGQKETSMLTYEDGLENDPAITDLYYAGYTYPVVQIYNDPSDPDAYKLYLAEVVELSKSFDGAILKIVSDINGVPVTGQKFNKVPIGNSDLMQIGQELMVLGFPAQHSNIFKDFYTLTVGRHSGIDFVFDEDWGFMKTDAQINPGNSGGPVFNSTGQVIGIASAKGVQTGIGLVGGINAMYYIAGPKPALQGTFAKMGLSPSKRKGTIAVVDGNQKSRVPNVKQWYAAKQGGGTDALLASNKAGGDGAHVYGLVKSADSGQPLAGVSVGIIIEKNGEYVVLSQGQSNGQGQFRMDPGIANGKYYFAAVYEGYEDIVSEVDVVAGSESFTVTMSKKQ